MTFRLADSLPSTVLKRIVAERRAALEKLNRDGLAATNERHRRIRRLFSGRIEGYLDRGSGGCFLANPGVAQTVVDALRHFDGERYTLYAWCVMPNHVHVVFQTLSGYSLSEIVHSWKSYTAQRANAALGKTGIFWQREYYDHLIRNGEQFNRAVRYIGENPARAGLKNWKWVWTATTD